MPITWMHCAAKLRCLAADRKKTRSENTWVLPRARAHSIPKYSGMSPFLFLAFRNVSRVICLRQKSFPVRRSRIILSGERCAPLFLFTHSCANDTKANHRPDSRKWTLPSVSQGFLIFFKLCWKVDEKVLERRSWGSPPSRNFIFLTSRKNERTFVRCRMNFFKIVKP